MNELLLSIIIVTWNVKHCIEECLNSVEKATRGLSHELIVIDNASSDGTVNVIKHAHPNSQAITIPTNIGFSAANNLGIEHTRGKYILLLNPDTIVEPDAIIKMIGYLQLHSDVGLVGPRTYDALGSDQSDAARRNPTLSRVLFQSLGLSLLLQKSGFLESLRICIADREQSMDVDMISGACMMLPRVILHKVGYLDEQIFLYAEDDDFCYRVWKAGYRVVFLHTAKISHLKGQSLMQIPVFSREMGFISNDYFYRKHFGVTAALMRRLLWIPGSLLRIVIFAFLTILINGQRRMMFNNVVAYIKILARLMGIRENRISPNRAPQNQIFG